MSCTSASSAPLKEGDPQDGGAHRVTRAWGSFTHTKNFQNFHNQITNEENMKYASIFLFVVVSCAFGYEYPSQFVNSYMNSCKVASTGAYCSCNIKYVQRKISYSDLMEMIQRGNDGELTRSDRRKIDDIENYSNSVCKMFDLDRPKAGYDGPTGSETFRQFWGGR